MLVPNWFNSFLSANSIKFMIFKVKISIRYANNKVETSKLPYEIFAMETTCFSAFLFALDEEAVIQNTDYN